MECTDNVCNIYEVGCIPTCGNVIFENIIIPEAGNYYAVYDHNGIQIKSVFTILEDGDPVVLNVEKFPVNKEITFHILDADDEDIEFEIDAVTYHYFRVKLTVGLTSEEVDAPARTGAWQQVIQGTGTDSYVPEKPIYLFDLIQIFRDGILCRKDTDLSEVNTYKILSGAVVLSHDLETDSYLHIFKF